MTITTKISAWFKIQAEWWVAHWEAVAITGCLALLVWAVALYLGHPNSPLPVPPGGKVVTLAPVPTFDVIQDGSRLILIRHRGLMLQATLLLIIYLFIYPLVSLILSIWHDHQVRSGKKASNRFPVTLRMIGAHFVLISILGFYLYQYGYRMFAIVAFPEEIVFDPGNDTLWMDGSALCTLSSIDEFYGTERKGTRYRSGEWGLQLYNGRYRQLNDDPFIGSDVVRVRGDGSDLVSYLNRYLIHITSEGFKYLGNDGNPPNYPKAFGILVRDAAKGNVAAQTEVASLYYHGRGTQQDYKLAEYWYAKAASRHDEYAEAGLGDLYSSGLGAPFDDGKAMQWYKRAAIDGSAYAANMLGVMYQTGEGTKVDYREAMKWYWQAASAGNAAAEYNLGDLYAGGEGVPKTPSTAIYWYTKAAVDGNFRAQTTLANMYVEGVMADVDPQKANYWFKKAADHDFDNFQDYRRAVFRIVYANINYPPSLRYARVQGGVQLFMTLGRNGISISDVKILKTSGNKTLDQAVVDAAKTAILPPLPDSMKKIRTLTAFFYFNYDSRND